MSKLPFSTFKQGSKEYEVVDKVARDAIGNTARKIFFLGDSYGETYQSSGQTITGWLDKMSSVMGSGVTIDSRSEAISGYGFLASGAGHQWIEKINAISTPDDSVTDVCFIGGHNDAAYADMAQLGSVISNTIDAAKVKFPKAKIWVGFCSIALESNEPTLSAMSVYCSGTMNANGIFMKDLAYCLFNYDYWLNANHPNNAGTTLMARWIAEILNDGVPYNGSVGLATRETDSSVPVTTAPDIFFEIQGEDITLYTKSTNQSMTAFLMSGGSNVRGDGANMLVLGKYPRLPFGTGPINLGSLPCLTSWQTAGYVNGIANFIYEGGYLKLRILALNNGSYINQSGTDSLQRVIFAGIKLTAKLIGHAGD